MPYNEDDVWYPDEDYSHSNDDDCYDDGYQNDNDIDNEALDAEYEGY